MNESRTLYVLVKNATVINGAGVPPFIADIGLVASRRVRDVDGRRELQTGDRRSTTWAICGRSARCARSTRPA